MSECPTFNINKHVKSIQSTNECSSSRNCQMADHPSTCTHRRQIIPPLRLARAPFQYLARLLVRGRALEECRQCGCDCVHGEVDA